MTVIMTILLHTILSGTEMVFAILENSIIVKLGPADMWTNPCKCPFALYFFVPDCSGTVGVPLNDDFLHSIVSVPLVRNPKLMRANNLLVANLLPCAQTNEVLCLQ